MKYLLSKDKVFENWFNPVLDGSTLSGPMSNITNFDNPFTNPQNQISYNDCNDMIDKPAWLDPDAEPSGGRGDSLSIGAYYINGVPLSSWSSRVGGSAVATYRHNMMQNFYYTDALLKRLFPNGIQVTNKKDRLPEYKINSLKIVKMNPVHGGIAFDIFIRFKLDQFDDNEIWGKFENVGLDTIPQLQCAEINNLNKEEKIKIKGKLWNTISKWFKVKSGIYKVISDKVIVYTEFGQIKMLESGNIIEVIYADEDKIKIRFNEQIYIIKKPTYYWFNWYIEKQ